MEHPLLETTLNHLDSQLDQLSLDLLCLESQFLNLQNYLQCWYQFHPLD